MTDELIIAVSKNGAQMVVPMNIHHAIHLALKIANDENTWICSRFKQDLLTLARHMGWTDLLQEHDRILPKVED